jgi:hypothetical protein
MMMRQAARTSMTEFEKILLGVIMAAVIGGASTAFWWILNKISTSSGTLHARLDAHDQRHSDYVSAANDKFVRRDDFAKFNEKLDKQMDKMNDKLDKIIERNNPHA